MNDEQVQLVEQVMAFQHDENPGMQLTLVLLCALVSIVVIAAVIVSLKAPKKGSTKADADVSGDGDRS